MNKIFGHKTLLGKLIRYPLKLIPVNAVLFIINGPLKGYRWTYGSIDKSCFIGKYETELVSKLKQYVSKDSVFYDLGAHVGYITLIASKYTGKQGRVIAFEPDPRNYKVLQKHVEINKISNVRLNQYAVSNTNSQLRFKQANTSLASKLSDEGDIIVPVIDLGIFIEKENLPLPELIKMDIEGHELNALKSIEKILVSKKPIIFLSTHGDDMRMRCMDFLQELNFVLQPLDTNTLGTATEFLVMADKTD